MENVLLPGDRPLNTFKSVSIKIYAVGTQNNRLKETVLLSNQNIFLNLRIRFF